MGRWKGPYWYELGFPTRPYHYLLLTLEILVISQSLIIPDGVAHPRHVPLLDVTSGPGPLVSEVDLLWTSNSTAPHVIPPDLPDDDVPDEAVGPGVAVRRDGSGAVPSLPHAATGTPGESGSIRQLRPVPRR